MEKYGTIEPRRYVTCLWPGLSELWWRGRLSALPIAIAFALAFNTLLIMRFLYPQWLSGVLVRMACWVAVATWIFLVIRSARDLPELLAPRTICEEPDRFDDAQHAYLAADWDEAEKLLMGVLAIEPRDPPALLLLSGVYRHSERAEAARLVMTELSRLEIGEGWMLEIQAEMARIDVSLGLPNPDEESSENEEKFTRKNTADLTAA